VAKPVIESADVVPGHDGEAQLRVLVRYENGALGSMTLAAAQAERLLERCNVERAEDLSGQSWERLLDVLPGGDAPGERSSK
jgi:hypothetical protein